MQREKKSTKKPEGQKGNRRIVGKEDKLEQSKMNMCKNVIRKFYVMPLKTKTIIL